MIEPFSFLNILYSVRCNNIFLVFNIHHFIFLFVGYSFSRLKTELQHFGTISESFFKLISC